MTDSYNTKLSSEDEAKYEDWRSKLPQNLQSTYDYDLRGAYKADAKEASNGHLPDTFKKPNHPTFSTESRYSGKDGYTGGKWGGTDDAPTFKPSKSNLKNMSEDELQEYFQTREPASKLLLSPSDRRYGK